MRHLCRVLHSAAVAAASALATATALATASALPTADAAAAVSAGVVRAHGPRWLVLGVHGDLPELPDRDDGRVVARHLGRELRQPLAQRG